MPTNRGGRGAQGGQIHSLGTYYGVTRSERYGALVGQSEDWTTLPVCVHGTDGCFILQTNLLPWVHAGLWLAGAPAPYTKHYLCCSKNSQPTTQHAERSRDDDRPGGQSATRESPETANSPGTLQREGSVSGAQRGLRLPAFG